MICPWAFPEKNKLIQINDDVRELIVRGAKDANTTADALANEVLRAHFSGRRR